MDKKHTKRLKGRLFQRIFLAYIASFIFLMLLFFVALVPMQKKSAIEVLHYEAKTMATTLSLIAKEAIVKDDNSLIIEYCLKLLADNTEIKDILFVNKYSNIIEIKKEQWRLLKKLPLKYKSMQKERERYHIFEEEDAFHYVYPVVFSNINWGWIHIDYSLKQYHETMQALYIFMGLFVSAVSFIIIIVSYLISKYISEPILQLRNRANAIARGDFSQKVSIKRDDELGELADDFNLMIEQLRRSQAKLLASREDLEKKVEQRTEELNKLNRELDNRVKEAVAKNSKQEQMLIQQSRLAAMGEMIGNIAHQWRQPLNALGLILQNIYYEYESGELTKEELEHFMNKGKKLTQTMSKTIDDFRNFFRPNKRVEPFSIKEAFENTKELISASYKNHNIELKIEMQDEIIVKGFANEFSQVLLNILTNAKDAIIERNIRNGRVILSSKEAQDKVIIDISDNGGGIAPEILPNIFDPYFTTKDQNIGTGIGLYMSKMIIENNMHGKIVAQNIEGGAKFTITIPKEMDSENA